MEHKLHFVKTNHNGFDLWVCDTCQRAVLYHRSLQAKVIMEAGNGAEHENEEWMVERNPDGSYNDADPGGTWWDRTLNEHPVLGPLLDEL